MNNYEKLLHIRGAQDTNPYCAGYNKTISYTYDKFVSDKIHSQLRNQFIMMVDLMNVKYE